MEIFEIGKDGVLPIIDFRDHIIVIKDEFEQYDTNYFLLDKKEYRITNLLTHNRGIATIRKNSQEACQYFLTDGKPAGAKSCIMLLNEVEFLELIKQIHGIIWKKLP